MGCVPTIFADLLRYADEHPELDLSLAEQRRLRRLRGAAVADDATSRSATACASSRPGG